MAIIDLATHAFAYVTQGELAEYWRLRPSTLIQAIEEGRLEAVRFAPNAYRISVTAALAFERAATACPRVRRGRSPSKAQPRKKRND